MDENFRLIKIDTLYSKTKTNYIYSSNDYSIWNDKDEKKHIFLKHKFKNFPYVINDSFELGLEMYDEDLKPLFDYDITDQVDNVKSYRLLQADDKYYTIYSTEYGPNHKDRERIEIIDNQGKSVERVVYQSYMNDTFGNIAAVLKLKYEPGVLIMNNTNLGEEPYRNRWVIYKTDGHGNMQLIKQILFSSQYGGGLVTWQQLDNGNILMNSRHRDRSSMERTKDERTITSLWDAKELGIATSNEDPIKNLKHINVYPNPATNMIHITGMQHAKYKVWVFNLAGNQIINTDLQADGIQEVQIDHLIPGMYYLQLMNEDGLLEYVSSFVKE